MAPRRPSKAPVPPEPTTHREKLEATPWSFDLLGTLRELERGTPDKPRIGNATVLAEEIVRLGQDPFLAFPASNISRTDKAADGTLAIYSRFLGFFGPQGALPINVTVEALEWSRRRDPSYARFADIFASRFLQLFFRAWADARPIAQFDRPAEDRFIAYLGAMAGFGTEAAQHRDRVPDIAKLPYVGLVASKVKSASRLKKLIHGVLGVDVEVKERIGTWLVFEPGDRTALGRSASALGSDMFLGGRVHTINEKFRITIKARNLAHYRRFLPTGDLSRQLSDLVFFYVGHRQDFDIELALPAKDAPAMRLGEAGELGWTGWMNPSLAAAQAAGGDGYLRDARFQPSLDRVGEAAETPSGETIFRRSM